MRFSKFYLFGLLSFSMLSFQLFAQNNVIIEKANSVKNISNDTLSLKDYKYLYKRFYKTYDSDTILAKMYARQYIVKAKKERDTLKIAYGYYFSCFIGKNVERILKYSDSIIAATKNVTNEKFPALAYNLRAGAYFYSRNFKLSLDNYLKVTELTKNNNKDLYISAKHAIGLLKSRLGNYEDALMLFKDCYDHSKSKIPDSKYDKKYLWHVFALSDTYMRLVQLDSATYYNKKGYDYSKLVNHDELKNYFILNEGMNEYWKGNYQASIDSIKKSLPTIVAESDQPNIAHSYYYLGKSYKAINQSEKSLNYFKKVDTVFQKISDLHPEIREGYEILITYYKNKEDSKNQIVYIEKLLKLDSVLKINYEYLSNNLHQKYDTPNLLNQKVQIINELGLTNKKITITLIILSFASLLIFWGYFKNIQKKKFYKESFEKLMQKTENQQIEERKELKSNRLETLKEGTIDIPQNVFESIAEKLLVFKSNEGFLDPNLSSNSLAKSFNTNVRYLSKTIQFTEHKNFIDYINDLRIDYAIDKMKFDKNFRKYTIKAIAEEVGFNNANSFSRAFMKKTNIKPSYFLKELDMSKT